MEITVGPVAMYKADWQVVKGNSFVASLQYGNWYKHAYYYALPRYDDLGPAKVSTLDLTTQFVTGDHFGRDSVVRLAHDDKVVAAREQAFEHRALGRVRHRHRVVEEDHHAVAGEALERAFVLEDQLAHLGVVLPEDHHQLLGLGGFGEGREAAEVEEDDRHFPAVRLQGVLRAPRHDQLGELGREEALEPAQPLELAHLLGDLLKLLLGTVEPSHGTVVTDSSLRVGYNTRKATVRPDGELKTQIDANREFLARRGL